MVKARSSVLERIAGSGYTLSFIENAKYYRYVSLKFEN